MENFRSTGADYPVVAGEDGLQVPCEEFQIDIAFALDAFNFFSQAAFRKEEIVL